MTDNEYEDMRQRVDNMNIDLHGHIRVLGDKFDSHIIRFEKHERDVLERQDAQIASQTLNTEAINRLSESTQGLVEAWTTASSVAKFVRWASGLVVGGLALLAYFTK